jgi:hypothetical protein
MQMKLCQVDIVHKTRFADLIIIGKKHFTIVLGGEPSNLPKEMVCEAECPVVISPGRFCIEYITDSILNTTKVFL